MDIIANDGAYFLLLLFGMFVVGVHAYSLFGRSLESETTLQQRGTVWNIQLVQLAGRRAYAVGFICYLAVNELLFLILSTSSVILELSLSAIGNSHTVGALTISSSEINPLTPVLASSVVVAISEIKPFSQIEVAIRKAAHGAAGIPRHFNKVVKRIELFTQSDTAAGLSESTETLCNEGLQDLDRTATSLGIGEEESNRLKVMILDIRQLVSWTYGYKGERVWSVGDHTNLDAIKSKAQTDLELFHVKLKELNSDATTLASPARVLAEQGRWSDLSSMASDIRDKLTRLLALLLVNHESASSDRQIPDDMARLIAEVRDARADSFNANRLILATLFASAVAVIVACLYHLTIRFSVELTSRFATLDPTGELQVRGLPVSDYLLHSANRALGAALWDIAGLGLIFVVSAIVSLGVRSSRQEQGRWRPWYAATPPVLQYMTTGFLAVLITLLVYVIFLFLKLVAYPSLAVDDIAHFTSLMNDFGSNYLIYCALALMAFPLSIAVCRLNDDSENTAQNRPSEAENPDEPFSSVVMKKFRSFHKRHRVSMNAAAVCGVINGFLLLRINVLTGLDSALVAIVFPAVIMFIYLYIYAWCLEPVHEQNLDRQAEGVS